MAGVTLDSGPLIQLDKGKTQMTVWLKVAEERNAALSTPASVLAEVWRQDPRAARMARALATMDIVEVDEKMGKEAGALLTQASSSNRKALAIDALVVISAKRRGDIVLTTDPHDIGPLAELADVEYRTP